MNNTTQYEVQTLAEVGERLRISPLAVKRLVLDGKLPAIKAGQQVRIPRAAVDRLIQSGEAPLPGLPQYNVRPLNSLETR